jgi:Na+-translocating ferredoxin:NAD+ oxidoreductase RnfC subunit
VSQLLPSQESVYTQVNPTADIAELLRRQNPQGAGAHDIATVLDNVRTLFHG